MVTFHLQIQGRVQGVWFRESMLREAERLGVTGWVRNQPDGSVEATVQGPAGAINTLTEWVHSGPPLAHVNRVIQTIVEAPETFSVFEKRPG
jgi:acylphosphatase